MGDLGGGGGVLLPLRVNPVLLLDDLDLVGGRDLVPPGRGLLAPPPHHGSGVPAGRDAPLPSPVHDLGVDGDDCGKV